MDHFSAFATDPRALPVVWHQSLLTFVQRYKAEVTPGDKARLVALCASQRHYAVTPEVLRELAAGPSRGEAGPRGGANAGGPGGTTVGPARAGVLRPPPPHQPGQPPQGWGGGRASGGVFGRPGEDPRDLPTPRVDASAY